MRKPLPIDLDGLSGSVMAGGVAKSHRHAVDLFDNPESLKKILDEIKEQLGLEHVSGSLKTLIDSGSINGSGGHITMDFKLTGGEDVKKYHIKLGLDCDEISDEHRFDEIAYYSIYHNFGYGPKTLAAIYKDSIVLILEDANNDLEDGTHSRFSDWKRLKSITPEDLGQITEEFRGVFSRISTAGQITESKEDLIAIEILSLILGTDDVFKKPDNFGVRVFFNRQSEPTYNIKPMVVDLLPNKSYKTFFSKLKASRYCDDFDDPNKVANLIANLLLKLFDPINDQRIENAIPDFHIFEFFRGDNRIGTIDNLKGGLEKIFHDFDKKISDAFDISLKSLNEYCEKKGFLKKFNKSEIETLINKKRKFILDVGHSLREHKEIRDVLTGDWMPGKYKQTQGVVDIYEGHLKKLSFEEKLFPSPPMDREPLRLELGKEGMLGKRPGEEVIPEGGSQFRLKLRNSMLK